MPQPAHLDPSAYSAEGGPWGALLIHGFTGSVAETRPMGEYLAARGVTVRCPLLPGHGTTPLHLTRIHWQAWAEAVESALGELQRRCTAVFVGGMSLGSLLTLWLGAKHPEILRADRDGSGGQGPRPADTVDPYPSLCGQVQAQGWDGRQRPRRPAGQGSYLVLR